jgi:beta-phosphoglucomutase-like phosphatase (HAD superfamily)
MISRFYDRSDGKMRRPSRQRSENRATIEAVIFDLDGTVVDSNDLTVAARDCAFRHFGKKFSESALRKHGLYGTYATNKIRRVMKVAALTDPTVRYR